MTQELVRYVLLASASATMAGVVFEGLRRRAAGTRLDRQLPRAAPSPGSPQSNPTRRRQRRSADRHRQRSAGRPTPRRSLTRSPISAGGGVALNGGLASAAQRPTLRTDVRRPEAASARRPHQGLGSHGQGDALAGKRRRGDDAGPRRRMHPGAPRRGDRVRCRGRQAAATQARGGSSTAGTPPTATHPAKTSSTGDRRTSAGHGAQLRPAWEPSRTSVADARV